MSSMTRELRAVDRPVEQRQHLVDLAELEMIEREMPPVVDREEAVARPAVGVRAHPGDAVCWRPCISITCATACCAQPSRGSSSTARAAPRLGVRYSHRSPRGRRRACRAWRDSRARSVDQAGSARAMRSRSMRESPRKKSIWWPTCSASTSRGCSIATSSMACAAACQRPSTRSPIALRWPAPRRWRASFAAAAVTRARPEDPPAPCRADGARP